jgi:hypothetical protein
MLGSSSATPTISTGSQAYQDCKMANQLKKSFVYSSPIPENLSAVQGFTFGVLRKSFIFQLNAVWNSVVKYTRCVARKVNL